MTLDELKAEVAALSTPDRVAFAHWILQCEDVKEFQHEAEIHDIRAEPPPIERGDRKSLSRRNE
jgi:hypothetical protein